MDAAAVLRNNSATFNYASIFLDPEYGERIRTLYVFCRHVDDLADKSACRKTALAALDFLEAELSLGRSRNPTVASFLDLASEAGIKPALPWTLVTGVKSDLGPVAFETEALLIRYAYQVAGVVGLMMCRVLDVDDSRADPYAIDLGIAMQLTNIARDVAEDARLGRRYLPGPWVGGVSSQDLIDPERSLRPVLRSAIARLLRLADQYYESGWQGLPLLPTRSRFAVALASRLYREIGRQISAQSWCVWDGKVAVSNTAKLGCTLRTIPFVLLNARRPVQPHKTRLHSALSSVAGTSPYPGSSHAQAI